MYTGLSQAALDTINSNSRHFNCNIYISTQDVDYPNDNYSLLQCKVINAKVTTGIIGESSVGIGNAYSACFTAVLNSVPFATVLENQYIYVEWECDYQDDSGTFTIPVGYFKVFSAPDKYGVYEITAYDRMSYRFTNSLTITTHARQMTLSYFFQNELLTIPGVNINYTDIVFNLADVTILKNILIHYQYLMNVNGHTDGLDDVPDVINARELVGYVACMLGANAYFNRSGNLVFQQLFQHGETTVGADRYMSLEKNKVFTVGKFISQQYQDTTYEVGSGQSISVSNVFIDTEIFNKVAVMVVGFWYVPGDVTMFGNPLIDPGDFVSVTDIEDETYSIPGFQIEQTFDGGISTRVVAGGDTESAQSLSAGPLQRAVQTVSAQLFTTNKIVAEKADVTYLTANYATINELNSAKARITTLETNNITTEYLDANYANIGLTNIADGTIKQAMIDTGAIGTVQIADGSITDAKIVGMTANKITAGTIDASSINVVNIDCANLTVGKINGVQIADEAINAKKLDSALQTRLYNTEEDVSNAVSDAKNALDIANGIEVGTQNLVNNTTSDPINFTPKNAVNEVFFWQRIRWEDYNLSKGDTLAVSLELSWSGMTDLQSDVHIFWQNFGKDTSGTVLCGTSFDEKLNGIARIDELIQTSESGTYVYKFLYTVTEHDATSKKFETLRIRADYSNGTAKIGVSKFMVTKGTKHVDWSPSVSDIEKSISDNSISNWCYNGDKAYIDGNKVYAGTILANAIGANQIVADKIATDAVIATKIQAGAVETDKIAANAVTTVKLATGAVTTDVLDARSVTADKIEVGAILSENIHSDAITTDKIVAEAITGSKIAANTITANNIMANTITGDKIVAGTITADKLSVADLYAVAAKIGGWSISPGYIFNKAYAADGSYTQVTLESGTSPSNYAFWIAHYDSSGTQTSVPFHVSNDGTVVATDATLTGTISSRSDEQKLSSTLGSGYLLLTNDSGHAINARANGISLSDPLFASTGSVVSAAGAVFNSRASTSDTIHTSQYMGYEARIGGPVYAAGHVFSGGIWCVRALNNSVDYISDAGSYLNIGRFGKDAVGITYNVSDPKFKDNIAQTQVNGSNLVRQIGLYQFDWNAFEPGKHEEIGFNARELAEIKKDFALVVKQDDGSEIYQVDERRLLPVYAKCLQEILDRLDNIEGRIGIIEQNM